MFVIRCRGCGEELQRWKEAGKEGYSEAFATELCQPCQEKQNNSIGGRLLKAIFGVGVDSNL